LKKIFLLIILVLVIFLAYRIIHRALRPGRQLSENMPAGKAEELMAALNGEMVSPPIAQSRPIAVMVENHPDARPQSGLSQADLVYEAVAEGGITRFMAVYQTKAPANIGPIRSARTYFATLADELGAVYAHVGGNSDVLANIRAGDYKNISNADQFFYSDYFHRIASRHMPHNVYTPLAALGKLVADKHWNNQASFEPWQFKDDSATSTPIKNISIDFSTPSFAVGWRYNSSANSYLRDIAGTPDKDANDSSRITAKNVIVQLVSGHPIQTDTIGSIWIDLIGMGKAKIFLDGAEINSIWKKEAGDRTRYFDLSGQEIKLNRGTTWVELVPVEKANQLTWQ
jgi:hypothetical protein